MVLTPESTDYRSWFPAGSEQQLQDYCAQLRRKHDLWIVDARDWLADDEFMDGHHVMEQGAVTFTRRLEQEVLGKLVSGSALQAGLDRPAGAPPLP